MWDDSPAFVCAPRMTDDNNELLPPQYNFGAPGAAIADQSRRAHWSARHMYTVSPSRCGAPRAPGASAPRPRTEYHAHYTRRDCAPEAQREMAHAGMPTGPRALAPSQVDAI